MATAVGGKKGPKDGGGGGGVNEVGRKSGAPKGGVSYLFAAEYCRNDFYVLSLNILRDLYWIFAQPILYILGTLSFFHYVRYTRVRQ